ncbi:MAG: hypothetical protein LBR37_03825 [Erysipelotrichaceae bacterium]|jgi:hypothetical protein|nr:hypothetical protein [Erysipelotrichaceae bacterium]
MSHYNQNKTKSIVITVAVLLAAVGLAVGTGFLGANWDKVVNEANKITGHMEVGDIESVSLSVAPGYEYDPTIGENNQTTVYQLMKICVADDDVASIAGVKSILTAYTSTIGEDKTTTESTSYLSTDVAVIYLGGGIFEIYFNPFGDDSIQASVGSGAIADGLDVTLEKFELSAATTFDDNFNPVSTYEIEWNYHIELVNYKVVIS